MYAVERAPEVPLSGGPEEWLRSMLARSDKNHAGKRIGFQFMSTRLISTMMEDSGVRFGTSGARGLVVSMTDEVCYAYTTAFLQHLESKSPSTGENGAVAVAGDLRPSTPRIMAAVMRAVSDAGYTPRNCGRVPSPAVALHGLQEKIPAIMVTGSHIPDDRNGIKYNTPAGEILKEDEQGIRAQSVDLSDLFDGDGSFREGGVVPELTTVASDVYVARWLDSFPSDFLSGVRMGLYQHSAVGRDLLRSVYESLGASVSLLAPSEEFVPVDTEAIRNEDVELARRWAESGDFDCIVSTDGDSDRPLISDEKGKWIRGDVAGILTARYLSADVVVTPVSSNSAVESCGWFREVHMTRIGSPYVIAEMIRAVQAGGERVVGYEANGGFLTATAMDLESGTLEPLPTRDPVIVHLGVLGLAKRENVSVSGLLDLLPRRFTASDRLQSFPTDISLDRIEELTAGGSSVIEAAFPTFGAVRSADSTDGLRIRFVSGDLVHLRPSGNAPELRCYSEADTEERAWEVNRDAMTVLQTWRE